jgi:hypothetical protein
LSAGRLRGYAEAVPAFDLTTRDRVIAALQADPARGGFTALNAVFRSEAALRIAELEISHAFAVAIAKS